MYKKINLFLIVLLAIYPVRGFATNTDRLLVVDEAGNLHELKNEKWEKIATTEIEKPDFEKKSNARVTQNNTKVEILQGNNYIDSGFNPPPGKILYRNAVQDDLGNLIVELGGSGDGFNYKIQGGPAIIWNRMEWNSNPPLVPLKAVAPIPQTNEFFVIAADAELYKITPPNRGQRAFTVEHATQVKNLENLHLLNGKIYASNKDGFFQIENFSGSADSIKAKNIKLPTGVKENFSVVTNSFGSTDIQALIVHKHRMLESKETPRNVVHVKQGKSIEQELTEHFQMVVRNREPTNLGAFLGGVEKIFNDDLAELESKGEIIKFFGRDEELHQTLDTLVRIKGKNPVLVGEPGVGKTTVAEKLAYEVMQNKLPEGAAYESLKNAVVIQTTAGKISSIALSNDPNSQQAAMEKFIKGLKEAEKKLGRPIILYIDEMHTLSEPQLQALKPVLDSHTSGIRFIGSTTNNEFGRLIKDDDAFRRRLQQVTVREFTPDETVEVLREAWQKALEKKYNVKLDDDVLRAAVRAAPEYTPHSHRPEGPFKLLQDAAIQVHRKNKGSLATMQDQDVYNKVLTSLRSPLNPYDREKFTKDIENLRKDLSEKVVDQERVTDTMLDLWRDLNQSTGKNHRTMLVAGPTGAGKTFSAQKFAELALGSEERLLEIDATKYATGGLSLNSLIGAPPGVVSSDKNNGLLAEFLDGRGRGQNVIVINEIDKAHPDFMRAIMELLDTGKFQAANGKTYYLGKSLIVFTTNKGDEYIYPRGNGGALSRKELEARLSRIRDKDVRGYFMQPGQKNLYDTSSELPASVLNRIDAAVPAGPPSYEGAQKIANQQVEKISKNLKDLYKFEVKLSNDAAKHFVDAYYVPEDGVRDLNRAVENTVNKIVMEMEKISKIKSGEILSIDFENANFIGKLSSGIEVKLLAPRVRNITNPLSDPEEKLKYANLEAELKKNVFGQDDAVAMTARAMRSKVINSQSKKPATFLYLGSTGTGKTELAKTLAQKKFGSADRLVSFNMGQVKWEGDLNNIFGSPLGIVGSEKMPPFEKFLNDFPEGGVILFDEIGNMGGGLTSHSANTGANAKGDMLKKFYEILDEGKWRSPHGKVYDLSKYVIGFTSNEGQELFEKLPSDDLRLAAWEENKGREKIIKLLKKHAWPEALVARFQGNIALFKPLMEEERINIAKKFVTKAIQEMTAQHEFKSITFDKDFYKVVANSFFSHTEGARNIGNLAEFGITDMIGKALFTLNDLENTKNAKLHFSVSDNYEDKFSYKGKTPPKREVLLKLKIQSPEGEENFISDLADEATEKRLTSAKDSLRTAYHEAGHATVNDPLKTGQKLEFVTIRGKGGYGGYARYKSNHSKQNLSYDDVAAKIGSLLAGREAEKMRGFVPDTGWASDLEKARQLAEAAVTHFGLTDNALGFPTKDGKVDLSNPKVQQVIAILLQAGEEYAKKSLKENWSALRLVTNHLVRNGHMDGATFDKLINKAGSSEFKKLASARSLAPPKENCQQFFRGLLGH